MSRIILSDIAQNGVKGAVKKKIRMSNKYKEAVREADERIEDAHVRYAKVYKKASTYLIK